MGRFSFRYDSEGVGNSTIRISVDEQVVEFYATYVGRNPLGDLLDALADSFYYDSWERSYLRWYSEPGCLQFIVEPEDDKARLRVLEFNEDRDYNNVSDEEWVVKIDAILDYQEIVESVILEVERNIRKHGIVGFSKDWCCHKDELGISDYLYLKGIRTMYQNDIQSSPLEKEIEILNSLLQTK